MGRIFYGCKEVIKSKYILMYLNLNKLYIMLTINN